jgi:hypothetical protein
MNRGAREGQGREREKTRQNESEMARERCTISKEKFER